MTSLVGQNTSSSNVTVPLPTLALEADAATQRSSKYAKYAEECRKLMHEVDRILNQPGTTESNFQTVSAKLKVLQGTFEKHRDLRDVPDKVLFFRTMQACFVDCASAGVHRQAVQTVETALGVLGPSGAARCLPLLITSLFARLPTAASQTVALMRGIVREHLLKMHGNALKPVVPIILAGLLPLMEHTATGDDKETINLIDAIASKLNHECPTCPPLDGLRTSAVGPVGVSSPPAQMPSIGPSITMARPSDARTPNQSAGAGTLVVGAFEGHRVVFHALWTIVWRDPTLRASALQYMVARLVPPDEQPSTSCAVVADAVSGAPPASPGAFRGSANNNNGGFLLPPGESAYGANDLRAAALGGSGGLVVRALCAAVSDPHDATQTRALEVLLRYFPLGHDEPLLGRAAYVEILSHALFAAVTNRNPVLVRLARWVYGGSAEMDEAVDFFDRTSRPLVEEALLLMARRSLARRQAEYRRVEGVLQVAGVPMAAVPGAAGMTVAGVTALISGGSTAASPMRRDASAATVFHVLAALLQRDESRHTFRQLVPAVGPEMGAWVIDELARAMGQFEETTLLAAAAIPNAGDSQHRAYHHHLPHQPTDHRSASSALVAIAVDFLISAPAAALEVLPLHVFLRRVLDEGDACVATDLANGGSVDALHHARAIVRRMEAASAVVAHFITTHHQAKLKSDGGAAVVAPATGRDGAGKDVEEADGEDVVSDVVTKADVEAVVRIASVLARVAATLIQSFVGDELGSAMATLRQAMHALASLLTSVAPLIPHRSLFACRVAAALSDVVDVAVARISGEPTEEDRVQEAGDRNDGAADAEERLNRTGVFADDTRLTRGQRCAVLAALGLAIPAAATALGSAYTHCCATGPSASPSTNALHDGALAVSASNDGIGETRIPAAPATGTQNAANDLAEAMRRLITGTDSAVERAAMFAVGVSAHGMGMRMGRLSAGLLVAAADNLVACLQGVALVAAGSIATLGRAHGGTHHRDPSGMTDVTSNACFVDQAPRVDQPPKVSRREQRELATIRVAFPALAPTLAGLVASASDRALQCLWAVLAPEHAELHAPAVALWLPLARVRGASARRIVANAPTAAALPPGGALTHATFDHTRRCVVLMSELCTRQMQTSSTNAGHFVPGVTSTSAAGVNPFHRHQNFPHLHQRLAAQLAACSASIGVYGGCLLMTGPGLSIDACSQAAMAPRTEWVEAALFVVLNGVTLATAACEEAGASSPATVSLVTSAHGTVVCSGAPSSGSDSETEAAVLSTTRRTVPVPLHHDRIAAASFVRAYLGRSMSFLLRPLLRAAMDASRRPGNAVEAVRRLRGIIAAAPLEFVRTGLAIELERGRPDAIALAGAGSSFGSYVTAPPRVGGAGGGGRDSQPIPATALADLVGNANADASIVFASLCAAAEVLRCELTAAAGHRFTSLVARTAQLQGALANVASERRSRGYSADFIAESEAVALLEATTIPASCSDALLTVCDLTVAVARYGIAAHAARQAAFLAAAAETLLWALHRCIDAMWLRHVPVVLQALSTALDYLHRQSATTTAWAQQPAAGNVSFAAPSAPDAVDPTRAGALWSLAGTAISHCGTLYYLACLTELTPSVAGLGLLATAGELMLNIMKWSGPHLAAATQHFCELTTHVLSVILGGPFSAATGQLAQSTLEHLYGVVAFVSQLNAAATAAATSTGKTKEGTIFSAAVVFVPNLLAGTGGGATSTASPAGGVGPSKVALADAMVRVHTAIPTIVDLAVGIIPGLQTAAAAAPLQARGVFLATQSLVEHLVQIADITVIDHLVHNIALAAPAEYQSGALLDMVLRKGGPPERDVGVMHLLTGPSGLSPAAFARVITELHAMGTSKRRDGVVSCGVVGTSPSALKPLPPGEFDARCAYACLLYLYALQQEGTQPSAAALADMRAALVAFVNAVVPSASGNTGGTQGSGGASAAGQTGTANSAALAPLAVRLMCVIFVEGMPAVASAGTTSLALGAAASPIAPVTGLDATVNALGATAGGPLGATVGQTSLNMTVTGGGGGTAATAELHREVTALKLAEVVSRLAHAMLGGATLLDVEQVRRSCESLAAFAAVAYARDGERLARLAITLGRDYLLPAVENISVEKARDVHQAHAAGSVLLALMYAARDVVGTRASENTTLALRAIIQELLFKDGFFAVGRDTLMVFERLVAEITSCSTTYATVVRKCSERPSIRITQAQQVQEYEDRTRALKRLAFFMFASRLSGRDLYTRLPQIRDILADSHRLAARRDDAPVAALETLRMCFVLLRVLMLKVPAEQTKALQAPVSQLLPEAYRLLHAFALKRAANGAISNAERGLIVEIIKVLDLSDTLALPELQAYRPLFEDAARAANGGSFVPICAAMSYLLPDTASTRAKSGAAATGIVGAALEGIANGGLPRRFTRWNDTPLTDTNGDDATPRRTLLCLPTTLYPPTAEGVMDLLTAYNCYCARAADGVCTDSFIPDDVIDAAAEIRAPFDAGFVRSADGADLAHVHWCMMSDFLEALLTEDVTIVGLMSLRQTFASHAPARSPTSPYGAVLPSPAAAAPGAGHLDSRDASQPRNRSSTVVAFPASMSTTCASERNRFRAAAAALHELRPVYVLPPACAAVAASTAALAAGTVTSTVSPSARLAPNDNTFIFVSEPAE